jgi:hypothetical protein
MLWKFYDLCRLNTWLNIAEIVTVFILKIVFFHILFSLLLIITLNGVKNFGFVIDDIGVRHFMYEW